MASLAQRPAFAQSAPIVQSIVARDLHNRSLVVVSYTSTVMTCPRGILSCWIPTLVLVNYKDAATGATGTALLKNVHTCRTCFHLFASRNGPMTAWRLQHYGIDADAVGRLLRIQYARQVHISPAALPEAEQTALTMQHALDTFEYRHYGAKVPELILDGYLIVRERCAPGKHCAWSRSVVLGSMHGADDGGSALFTNRKDCSSCFTTIIAGGGALDERGVESYGIDPVTAHALFSSKVRDDTTAP